MTDMKLGPRGAVLIKGKEVLRLVAYMPTPKDVPTIGWGHTRGVRMGMMCTIAQAESWFVEDTAEAVAAVNQLVRTGTKLSQSMFDALVSLAFNAGPKAIEGDSTIGLALRGQGSDYYKAFRGFALWTKQAGVDLRGLAIRRATEMALFFEDPVPR